MSSAAVLQVRPGTGHPPGDDTSGKAIKLDILEDSSGSDLGSTLQKSLKSALDLAGRDLKTPHFTKIPQQGGLAKI